MLSDINLALAIAISGVTMRISARPVPSDYPLVSAPSASSFLIDCITSSMVSNTS
jgi:hypothetical protein